jgi:predicted Rossmann fold flavoprotein
VRHFGIKNKPMGRARGNGLKKLVLEKYDVLVIGAGPAGLLAAGKAAESGAKVLVTEKMPQSGRKLLITGKGRCNVTNTAPRLEFLSRIYPAGRFLKYAFSQFFSADMIALLKNLGLNTVTEQGGRVFPVTHRAADVLSALLGWLKTNKVEFRFGCRVIELKISDGEATGVIADGPEGRVQIHAHRIIVCTGGKSYPATGSTGDGYGLAEAVGHRIEAPRPALVPLETEGGMARNMQGLSLKNVKALLWVNGRKQTEETGEMLFTHFGLSGPIILSLSRAAVDALRAHSPVEISIDLMPALDERALDTRLVGDLNKHGKKQLENALKLWLPSSMIPVFLDNLTLDPKKECHQVNSKERRKIVQLMKAIRFKVTASRSFEEAVITAGGVRTAEVNSMTMESKLVKNLYFAGEILDLDGDTGGYNLQVAWSTGYAAGAAAAAAAAKECRSDP